MSSKSLYETFGNEINYEVRRDKLVQFIENNTIEIKTEDAESSSSANEKIVCGYSGSPITVAFNCDYLREILEKTETEKATLLLKDDQCAALILPEKTESPLDKLSLLMPIRLN